MPEGMPISSWKDKRVLITGSSGFVGRNLASYLRERGANVLGLSRHPKDPLWEEGVDVTRQSAVSQVFSRFRPQVCFHLASKALVEFGAIEPHETFLTNIQSTLNVLDASRTSAVERIVIASTSHVYGKAPTPHTEETPALASRPYETSKACCDLIAQSYADRFNLPVIIPRFVNIYGPGDTNFSRIVPKTMRSVVQGKNPEMWGGKALRQYMYVDDAVRAYDMLAKISDKKLEQNRIYNIGTNDVVSVKDLIQKIIALSSKRVIITHVPSERHEEIPKQVVSWRKAHKILGWEPNVDMDTGLQRTLAWYTTVLNQKHAKGNT